MAAICNLKISSSPPPLNIRRGLRCSGIGRRKSETPRLVKIAVAGVTELLRVISAKNRRLDTIRNVPNAEPSISCVDDVIDILQLDYKNAYFLTARRHGTEKRGDREWSNEESMSARTAVPRWQPASARRRERRARDGEMVAAASARRRDGGDGESGDWLAAMAEGGRGRADGNFSSSVYFEDCAFEDPTIKFRGKNLYAQNIKLLVPFFEHPTLILKQIEKGADSDAKSVLATWKLRTYLKLPWKPLISIEGRTLYELDDELKIVRHAESWNVSALEAIGQIFTPGARKPGDQTTATALP
ncbi:hypothetical protein Scep_030331 [Stephania cephalantha]|uniref:Uncharacterized protein n=1 Tax=Stephania cephalantha TaxID=152367 RepID=A0AAP0DZD2_9MAGN